MIPGKRYPQYGRSVFATGELSPWNGTSVTFVTCSLNSKRFERKNFQQLWRISRVDICENFRLLAAKFYQSLLWRCWGYFSKFLASVSLPCETDLLLPEVFTFRCINPFVSGFLSKFRSRLQIAFCVKRYRAWFTTILIFEKSFSHRGVTITAWQRSRRGINLATKFSKIMEIHEKKTRRDTRASDYTRLNAIREKFVDIFERIVDRFTVKIGSIESSLTRSFALMPLSRTIAERLTE